MRELLLKEDCFILLITYVTGMTVIKPHKTIQLNKKINNQTYDNPVQRGYNNSIEKFQTIIH